MNKDIRKYIANCTLCHREKAKVQAYPLQMTNIPDRPFGKITMDLVMECETSNSGNKHILTIIDHLTGWPEASPIPDKLADMIVSTFISIYQYTCVLCIFCLTMAQSSRTTLWTRCCSRWELKEYFLHLTICRAMES